MMVYKDNDGWFWVQCDLCGNEEGPFDTFREAVDFKKDEWKSEKTGDSWVEKCPDCWD